MTKWSDERKYNNQRRLYARRIYKKYPLFALLFIQQTRYPEYTEELLLKDLIVKNPTPKKPKKVRHKNDFLSNEIRRVYSDLLFHRKDNNRTTYNNYYERLSSLATRKINRYPLKFRWRNPKTGKTHIISGLSNQLSDSKALAILDLGAKVTDEKEFEMKLKQILELPEYGN